MSKYGYQGYTGQGVNPWIKNIIMMAMSMPTDTPSVASAGSTPLMNGGTLESAYQAQTNPMSLNPVGNLSSPIPSLKTDIGTNLANTPTTGNFMGNLGKSLWQQSPIGQVQSRVGNVLNGNFNQPGQGTSLADPTMKSYILQLIKQGGI